VADEIAQQYVGHVIIDQSHAYTNRYYSNDYQIASPILRGYIPRISTRGTR
jgi:hypothetical protein